MHIGNSGPMRSIFWMVYGEGQRAPTYKHDTPESAEAEALRLAQANPGIAFYVLKAKRAVISERPEAKGWTLKKRLPDPDDDLPF